MLKNIGIILILSAVIFLGCEDPLKKERVQTRQEVMAIHDEMMPQMHKIQSAQKKLTLMIKNAEQQRDSLNLIKYKSAYQQLEVADRTMHDWMKQYSEPPLETPDNQAITYFKKQKVKVTMMKNVMVTNMNKAKQVIDF